MKIIKQFEDKDIKTINGFYFWNSFYWGLSEDGRLYFQINHIRDAHLDDWALYNSLNVDFFISFKSICRIAKEFGHLIIFT